MATLLEFNAIWALEAPLFPVGARVMHGIPGRLRLIVLPLKGVRARTDATCRLVRGRAAARFIQVNLPTGSRLIEHQPNKATRALVFPASAGV